MLIAKVSAIQNQAIQNQCNSESGKSVFDRLKTLISLVSNQIYTQ